MRLPDAEAIGPAKVEVEVLETMRFVTVVVPRDAVLVAVIAPPTNSEPEKYPVPCTPRALVGEVVPMPTLPPDVANNAPPVEEIAVVEAYVRLVEPETVSEEG